MPNNKPKLITAFVNVKLKITTTYNPLYKSTYDAVEEAIEDGDFELSEIGDIDVLDSKDSD